MTCGWRNYKPAGGVPLYQYPRKLERWSDESIVQWNSCINESWFRIQPGILICLSLRSHSVWEKSIIMNHPYSWTTLATTNHLWHIILISYGTRSRCQDAEYSEFPDIGGLDLKELQSRSMMTGFFGSKGCWTNPNFLNAVTEMQFFPNKGVLLSLCI